MPRAATRLFLIRHGEVEPHWQGRIYGALDVPLSERGRADGARVARILRETELAAVVSSGLARTEHMAACLRERRDLARVDDPAFRELERGEWAGLTRSELDLRWPGSWAEWFTSPASTRPPGGESLDDLLRRVRPRVDHWAAAHPGRSIALITHGWVVRVLVCHVMQAPLELAPRLDIRTGDITVLRWPGESVSDHSELEAFALDPASARLSEAQLSE